jgi:hypothetical protein
MIIATLEKLSPFVFFTLDLFFVASGLLYLRNPHEAIWGFLFLIFMWYLLWSINKIRLYILYTKENNQASFTKHYFTYVAGAIDVIGNDKQFGSTKFLRLTTFFLSTIGGLVGIGTVIFLNYETVIAAIGTKEMLSRYILLFLYISVYPLVTLFVHTLASGSNTAGLLSRLLAFFPLRFTQLFMYLFTFLSPFAWIGIAFLSYIVTKSKGVPIKG